jgi:hypothetical protein
LEIIEISAARALETPLIMLTFESGVVKTDLKNLAPTVLMIKPKPPTTPNLKNF